MHEVPKVNTHFRMQTASEALVGSITEVTVYDRAVLKTLHKQLIYEQVAMCGSDHRKAYKVVIY